MNGKIAHIGDCHLGLGYPGPKPESRFDDIVRTLDWCADRIIEAECDAVLFAGDAFKDSKVFLDRATPEIMAFVGWLRKLSEAGIPVTAISGTPSHDAVSAYELIREMKIPGVSIRTRPGVEYHGDFSVACLPGMNRSQIATKDECKGLQPREVHRLMTEKLRDLCWGMVASRTPMARDPVVLLSHMTMAGADTGFDDLVMVHEPVLTREAVEPYDFVCLGHIHRPQMIECGKTRVSYCGSTERLTFNDQCIEPGFWIHDLWARESEFVKTPARRFLAIDVDLSDGLLFAAPETSYLHAMKHMELGENVMQAKDAVVRVRLKCTDEQSAALDRKALERELYEAGAFFVSEIRVETTKTTRSRDEEVTESLGPVQALAKWCAARGAEEFREEDVAVMQSMAARLMEEVQA